MSTATITTLHTYSVQVALTGARGCLAAVVVLATSPEHARSRALAQYPAADETRRVTRRSPRTFGEV